MTRHAWCCVFVNIGVNCVTLSFAFGKIGKMRLNRKQKKRVAAIAMLRLLHKCARSGKNGKIWCRQWIANCDRQGAYGNRFTDYSYLGLFVLWVDYSYLGRFVWWTFHTTDYSYYGLFVPYIKHSHINCWCEKALTLQAVCQMQVDLGARLVICMCSCGMLVIF